MPWADPTAFRRAKEASPDMQGKAILILNLSRSFPRPRPPFASPLQRAPAAGLDGQRR
jgi:hypothetical protein